jgi:hypothetical protein
VTMPTPAAPPPSGSGPSPRETLKRHLLVMIVAAAVIDAVAIAAFYLFHIDRDEGVKRQTFVGVWTLLSFIVVAVQLRKIRAARVALMRSPDGERGTPPRPGNAR